MSSLGFFLSFAVHHFRVQRLSLASWTQEAMLASWSRRETMISESGVM